MKDIKASVVIPTHNRPRDLAETLSCLTRQSLDSSEYEIIVVDDGSNPAVKIPEAEQKPNCFLVRLEGVERSSARNAGAAAANGRLLVFVDDDITVNADFVAAHLRAHDEWCDALGVGSVQLPEAFVATPFGRFRQNLEQHGIPQTRGPKSMRNLCTAANMSVPREVFHSIGGFDSLLASSEDQDFALRHTARGGQIVFLPEAKAVHRDSALDIRSYCRRSEWGSEKMITFCQRYHDWPDNVERERVNGPVRLGRESLFQSLRKSIKLLMATRPVVAVLFGLVSILERSAPDSFALERVYRLLLGAHILRGYRKGRTRAEMARLRTAGDGQLAEG